MPSDSELLQRFTREASQAAFTELVQRHIDFVYATALRQAGSDARAQDVTQEVFTSLAKKAAGLIGRSDLVGWLHTSTRYAAASLRRSEARREEREQKAQPMHDDLPTTNDQIDWDKLRPLLDDALHALGERDREAILLRYFKQRSFGEIGATLGLSEEAARKRIDRSVEKLRSHLAKRGIVSSLVALELAMAGQAAVAAPAGLAATVATTSLAAVATSLIAAIGSGGWVVHSNHEARKAEQTLATEKQRLASQQKEQDRLTARQNEIESLRTANLEKLAALKTSTAAKIHRIWPKDSGEKIVNALINLNLDDKMQEIMKPVQRILWSTQYFFGPLFAKLHLTPEQIDRFFEIARGDSPQVLEYKFFDDGGGHGRFTFSLDQHNSEVNENALRQLLGDSGFAEWQEEFKTRSIRISIVNKLASNLVYTDSPINADTAKQLTRILANASSDPKMPSDTEIDWEKALKEAKSLLSPTQLAALARLSGNLSTSWSYVF